MNRHNLTLVQEFLQMFTRNFTLTVLSSLSSPYAYLVIFIHDIWHSFLVKIIFSSVWKFEGHSEKNSFKLVRRSDFNRAIKRLIWTVKSPLRSETVMDRIVKYWLWVQHQTHQGPRSVKLVWMCFLCSSLFKGNFTGDPRFKSNTSLGPTTRQ